jgi:23S rRNA pseudouridine2605 synthase
MENDNKKILQKVIVDSGYCSRRRATELIKAGRIKVNGAVAEVGLKVFSNDEIEIDGKKIENKQDKIYIIINKPEGYVCTNRSFKGEDNIFDLLVDKNGEKLKQRLFVVGRLDKNSRGLVLITNDGELTQKITHPSFEHEKTYKVLIKNEKLYHAPGVKIKNYPEDIILRLKNGFRIEGGMAKIKDGEYLGEGKFRIVLTQGIKRQIRLMFKELGLEVIDLKRTRIGCKKCGIDLGNLRCGEWRKMKLSEIEKLK